MIASPLYGSVEVTILLHVSDEINILHDLFVLFLMNPDVFRLL